MTDQEKKLQRAHLQVELEDAQGELAHLREKALSMAGNLEQVAKKLRSNAALNPSRDDFSVEFEMVNRLRPEQQGHLDFPSVIKVIEELKVARQNAYNLQERKSQLASANGWTIAS